MQQYNTEVEQILRTERSAKKFHVFKSTVQLF